MHSSLREFWITDFGNGNGASPLRKVDVPQVLARWAADPMWWSAARSMDLTDRRELLAILGRETYDADVGQFRSELSWNTRHLNYIWSEDARDRMLRQHTEMLFASLSDTIAFFNERERKETLAEVQLVGRDNLDDALTKGRGIILLGVYQSHPRFLLDHSCMAGHTVAVIRKMGEAASTPSLLFTEVPTNVRLLPASAQAVRSILELLACGEMVAYYNDFLYPGSGGVMSPLFGVPVLISRAILSIALRTRAVVLPVAIARRDPIREGVMIEVFSAVDLPEADARDPAALNAAALMIGVATECLIRWHPPAWRLWNTLVWRWRQALAFRRTLCGSS